MARGAALGWPKAVPHFAQNLVPGRLEFPHFGHATIGTGGSSRCGAAIAIDAPQPLQNFASSRFTVPQLGQRFAIFPPSVCYYWRCLPIPRRLGCKLYP